MKRAHFLAAAVLSVASLAVPIEAAELPGGPVGFSWVEIPEIRGAFLLPTGWHFRPRGDIQYFLTREPIEPGRSFEPGLTVSVVRKVSESTGWEAPAYSEAIASALSDGEELLDSWQSRLGTLQLFGARMRRTREGQAPVIFQRLVLGSDATDTMYILLFESPESSWQEMWKLGDTMLKQFRLGDAG
jgi:hypothetical protein